MQNSDIKICRVSTVPFSMVSQLMPQIEYLCDKKIDVTMVSSYGKEIATLDFNKGFAYHTIEIPRNLHPVKDIIALVKLILFFRKKRFHIVHSITPKAGLLCAVASFITKIPIRLHTWTGQPWVTIKGPMKTFAVLADKLIALLNTGCYADSKSQSRFLIEKKIVKPEKIKVIGYSSLAGVDLGRFHKNIISSVQKKQLKKELSINPEAAVFLFIGRMAGDKGFFELEKAFTEIADSGYKIHLLLVGPMDKDCGGKKNIDIDSFIDRPDVSYAGYTATPEKYFAISDILCLPSYREGFGTVVIEAASMGIPAIGTKINGLVDAVDDGKTGILVKARSIAQLYNAMIRLLNNPETVRNMGMAAQERCKLYFDSRKINREVYKEYIRLLNGRGFCNRIE